MKSSSRKSSVGKSNTPKNKRANALDQGSTPVIQEDHSMSPSRPKTSDRIQVDVESYRFAHFQP